MKRISCIVFCLAAAFGASSALADDNNNVSSIAQIGQDVIAAVVQEGNHNQNASDIQQGLGTPGNTIISLVGQGGSDNQNTSNLRQDGSDSYADVLQQGTLNINQSLVDQDGVGNEAYVTQDGSGTHNNSEITQNGTGALNSAAVDQSGTGNSNGAGISQNGQGLTASVVQQ